MDHYSLRAFLRLADSLHFGIASRESNVSPSTLSRIIKRLEDEVGESLFERDNRSVVLTETGLAFREYARNALGLWESFQSSMDERGQVLQGEITMCCTVTASYSIVADVLRVFRAKYPEIHIRLTTRDSADAVAKVLDGEVDVAVAARPRKLPGKALFKTLAPVQLRFIAPTVRCAADVLLAEKPVSWGRVPMILSAKGIARNEVDAWFRMRGIKPTIYAEVSGNEAIVSMVNLGCGVGVVPELVLENSPLKRKVRIIQASPELKPYDVGLCVLSRRLQSSLVRALWDIQGQK